MSKVITFSRNFPSYHSKKGESTFFVEKFWASVGKPDLEIVNQFIWPDKWLEQNFMPKHHTIRAGNRWKVGDKFSPRVWSGKPYNSPQIIIAPDIDIKKIWDIQIEGYNVWINTENFYATTRLANNDGLSEIDFWNWFPCKPGKIFKGQIICWNENIDY